MSGLLMRTKLKRLPGTPEPMHRWQGEQGLSIAGDSWGPVDGPLVILLHGGGRTRHAWKGTGALLGKMGCHAVALDARGHGDSDWSPGSDYSQDALVRDLQAVLGHLGNRRAVLIGASMGGITSLIAAGEGRVDAAALILVDVVPRCEEQGVARVKAFMRQASGFSSLDEASDAISRYQPQRTRPASSKGLAKNLRLASDGRYYWHWDPRYLDATNDSVERYRRLAASARQLRLPTLLVRGAQSDVVSQAGVDDFLSLCPHARTLEVANAKHMVVGDRNDVFAHNVWSFLCEHLPASRA